MTLPDEGALEPGGAVAPRSRAARWLRRLAPWLVTGAVLVLLAARYSPGAIAREMARGEALALVPWVALVAAGALVLMAAADWLLLVPALGAAGGRLGPFAVLRGRAGTSILMSLGYVFSSGGYGLWLARRSGAGAAVSVGALGATMLADLCSVFACALAAVLAGGDGLPPEARTALVILATGGVAGTALAALLGPRLLPGRLRRSRLASAWRRVPPGAWLVSVALRAATVALNIAGTWAAARTFGLDIPAGAMAVGLPIVYLAGAVPVSVGGLGPVQAVWVALFARWAPEPAILAFAFLYQLVSIAFMVLRGLPFLPGVLRDLEDGRGQAPAFNRLTDQAGQCVGQRRYASASRGGRRPSTQVQVASVISTRPSGLPRWSERGRATPGATRASSTARSRSSVM